jgi:hypothetical protein
MEFTFLAKPWMVRAFTGAFRLHCLFPSIQRTYLNLCRIRNTQCQFIPVNAQLHRISHRRQFGQGNLDSWYQAHIQKMLPKCTTSAHFFNPRLLTGPECIQSLHSVSSTFLQFGSACSL